MKKRWDSEKNCGILKFIKKDYKIKVKEWWAKDDEDRKGKKNWYQITDQNGFFKALSLYNIVKI